MIRQQTIRARDKLVSKMPVTGELLRGTLLERPSGTSRDARNARAVKAIRSSC
jgi:hypothetical protein